MQLNKVSAFKGNDENLVVEYRLLASWTVPQKYTAKNKFDKLQLTVILKYCIHSVFCFFREGYQR